MKLSKDTIEGLIEREDRMRNKDQLYKFVCIGGIVTPPTFLGFLRKLTYLGIFEKIGNHYKLADVKRIWDFGEKLG